MRRCALGIAAFTLFAASLTGCGDSSEASVGRGVDSGAGDGDVSADESETEALALAEGACAAMGEVSPDVNVLVYAYAYGTTALSQKELTEKAEKVSEALSSITDDAVEAGQLSDTFGDLAHLVTEVSFFDAQDQDDALAVLKWCRAEGLSG
jgi:hypothetical protein